MPFPESKRVIYGKNPLEEVVCQLRFPAILRIDAEAPAQFQDRVRAFFPLYQRVVTQTVALQLPPEVLQALAVSGGASHEFASADQIWKLSLRRDFIALTTKSYKDWADFKQKLAEPLAALQELYAPAFFSRVGLRYRDRIDRRRFGLEGVPWHDLLKVQVLGELGDPSIGPAVEHALRELVVRLPDGAGRVRIVHGLQAEDDNLVYIIDGDFFTEGQTQTRVVGDVLDTFNRRAGNLFRWYITQRLNDAMEPRESSG